MNSSPTATTFNWVTAGISVLAFGLSVLGLWLQRRDKSPRLKVCVGVGRAMRELSYDPRTDRRTLEPQPALMATLVNTGDRDITIEDGYVRPLFGRATKADHTIDYEYNQVKSDSTREIVVFPREAILGANILARMIGLYRLEVRDHMRRRWCSGYVRIHIAAVESTLDAT